MFKEIRDSLSEPVIDLFHDERLDDGIAEAVKFCYDAHPSETANYCCIMKEAFKKIFEVNFIRKIFRIFLAGEWKKENLYWEFLSFLANGQLIEVAGVIKAVLSVTCRFNKNMATKKRFLSNSRLLCDEKR